MKRSDWKVDPKLELEGTWAPLEPGNDSEKARLRVARAGNVNFQQAYARISEPHREALRSKNTPEALSRDLMLQAMAASIWLGFEEIYEDDGSPTPDTSEMRLTMLRECPDLAERVWEIAREKERFRAAKVEDAKGNSVGSSAGISAMASGSPGFGS